MKLFIIALAIVMLTGCSPARQKMSVTSCVETVDILADQTSAKIHITYERNW